MFLFFLSLLKLNLMLFRSHKTLITRLLLAEKEIEMLRRTIKKPKAKFKDRLLASLVTKLRGTAYGFGGFRPETILGWQRKLIRKFWTFEHSKGKPGRPPVSREIRELILEMKRGNRVWGYGKIQAETIYAMDFFTVDTILKERFYCYFIIHHGTRRVMRMAVTMNPVKTGVKAPNMNAIAERFVGSVRRECLDWFLIVGERQVKKLLKEYTEYYNGERPHQGIGQKIPEGKGNEENRGRIVTVPVLGGLYQSYRRAA